MAVACIGMRRTHNPKGGGERDVKSQQQDDAYHACSAYPEHATVKESEVECENGNLDGTDCEGRKDLHQDGEHESSIGRLFQAIVPGVPAEIAIVVNS